MYKIGIYINWKSNSDYVGDRSDDEQNDFIQKVITRLSDYNIEQKDIMKGWLDNISFDLAEINKLKDIQSLIRALGYSNSLIPLEYKDNFAVDSILERIKMAYGARSIDEAEFIIQKELKINAEYPKLTNRPFYKFKLTNGEIVYFDKSDGKLLSLFDIEQKNKIFDLLINSV